ncbi:MAG: NAD-dependent epimerase/dehydratase family protein [Negativicutes bacterium]
MNILVTGGAGFIGTNLIRKLLQEKYNVTILDNFSRQIHGDKAELAADIQGKVRMIIGSVTDKEKFHKALSGQDVVVHLAAETGTGQSMYEIERYEEVNIKGTAILLDYIVNNKENQIKKIVVASSRAIYGEGKYRCKEHGDVYPDRCSEDMKRGWFEPLCPICGSECVMLLTDEVADIHPSSFYGITKQMQEQMVLLFARAVGVSAFALRYQNVYGPGQSLKNPYTGILAIFSNQARLNHPIYIFEDGQESRDFVYIDDVVDATWRCILPAAIGVEALNVGSGEKTTVLQVVDEIIQYFGSNSTVSVNGAFREGDIRHNIADLAKVKKTIGYEPQWEFSKGIKRFLDWAKNEEMNNCSSQYEKSLEEMKTRGLMHE